MTTIAYRDGIMAADSVASNEESGTKYACQKIYEVNGTLIGTSGGSYSGLVFVSWYKGEQENDVMDYSITEDDDFECMVIEPSGELFVYNRYLIPEERGLVDFFAIGSGGKCAMSAMEVGATAVQAVKAACKYDLYSGEPVVFRRLPGHTKQVRRKK